MKIALFPSAFHPHLGGVEELTRQLAVEYGRRGHEMCVVTNRWPPELPAQERLDGLDVYRFPFMINDGPPQARARFVLGHRRVSREVRAVLAQRDVDVVHVQCVSTNGLYAREAADHLEIPLVVTAQGERTMDATRLYERSAPMNRLLRGLLSRADAVTACSQDVLDDLREYRGSEFPQPASVIYNGISIAEFDDETAAYARPRPYVLAMGRWVPQKGFDVLIDAFARAVEDENFDHDLLIAGAGAEGSSLKAQISRLGLGARVRLVGRADRAQAVALLKGCSIFALPSRREPLGIVNLEAMAAARPVVASHVGGVAEIVRDGVNGLLVPPEDPEALAVAIRLLAADPERRKILGAQGRRMVGEFTWPAIADQYERVYRTAMG